MIFELKIEIVSTKVSPDDFESLSVIPYEVRKFCQLVFVSWRTQENQFSFLVYFIQYTGYVRVLKSLSHRGPPRPPCYVTRTGIQVYCLIQRGTTDQNGPGTDELNDCEPHGLCSFMTMENGLNYILCVIKTY